MSHPQVAASSLFSNVFLIIYLSQNAPTSQDSTHNVSQARACISLPLRRGRDPHGWLHCLPGACGERRQRTEQKIVRVVESRLEPEEKHFQSPHPDRATTRSTCKEFALICIKIALNFLNDPRNCPLILVTRIRILLQGRRDWVILPTACHATIIQTFIEDKRSLLSSPRAHG